MMQLPLGVVDPLFVHELAIELGMTVSEIGDRMSARELCIEWPAYFTAKRRMAEREAEEQRMKERRVRR